MMDIKNIPGKLKTTCSFCVWKFEKAQWPEDQDAV